MKKFDNCIAIVCTETFLDFSLFLASELKKQNFINYDVVICSGDDLSHRMPENVQFFKIDAEQFTKDLPTTPRLQKFCYWRIPAIEVLSEIYEKILYLDTDIFVNGEGIGYLFNIDLKNHVIAAVRDAHQIVRPSRLPIENSALNLGFSDYFNAGFLLINGLRWKSTNSYLKVQEIGRKYPHALTAYDQSLLNLMCDGDWLELSPVWNWQYGYRNCFITDIISPKLIHFCGNGKFWNISDVMIPTRYREAYYLYLHQTLPTDFPLSTINFEFFKLFLKNLWYFKQHTEYVSKFKNAYMTISHSKN